MSSAAALGVREWLVGEAPERLEQLPSPQTQQSSEPCTSHRGIRRQSALRSPYPLPSACMMTHDTLSPSRGKPHIDLGAGLEIRCHVEVGLAVEKGEEGQEQRLDATTLCSQIEKHVVEAGIFHLEPTRPSPIWNIAGHDQKTQAVVQLPILTCFRGISGNSYDSLGMGPKRQRFTLQGAGLVSPKVDLIRRPLLIWWTSEDDSTPFLLD